MEWSWYVINVYSGFENKVAEAIKERSAKEGIADLFQEILVPTEEVIEIKKGAKIKSEQRFFPGYVLVKMALVDKAWHLIRSIPKVASFLGSKGKPTPISQAEVDRILKQVQEGAHPRHAISFETGDAVKVMDGPFATFQGIVEEIDEERSRLKVSVSILGRSTKIDLDFSQVDRI